MLHNINHGSDHEAIKTTFNISVPEQTYEKRLLFKNAPWNKIRNMILTKLAASSAEGDVQEQTDQFTLIISETIHTLTPKAKPSSYTKR